MITRAVSGKFKVLRPVMPDGIDAQQTLSARIFPAMQSLQRKVLRTICPDQKALSRGLPAFAIALSYIVQNNEFVDHRTGRFLCGRAGRHLQ